MFEGARSEAEAYLRTIQGKYYVYILCRPDTRPFYIGKGINKRVLDHELEARRHHPVGEPNPFKCNVIRKIIRDGGAVRYRIDSVYDLQDQHLCLEREAALIRKHRRLHEGGCLTNLAGGLGSMAGAAPFSLARHTATLSGVPTDNPDRATLNRFLQSIGPVGSVPVKPVAQMSRIQPTTPHPSPRQATARCAYALVASAAAVGLPLAPGAEVPRAFTYLGVAAIIENGVARDLVKADMASLVAHSDPRQERFRLSAPQMQTLIGLIGRDPLVARGLL